MAAGRQKGRVMGKSYDELTFSDDFMFCKVLSTSTDTGCEDQRGAVSRSTEIHRDYA